MRLWILTLSRWWLGAVACSGNIRLRELEMQEKPEFDALIRPDGVIASLLSTLVRTKFCRVIEVFWREIIFVIHQSNVFVNVVAEQDLALTK